MAINIKSGKFHAGSDLQYGENVTIDVAEEVTCGDRCTIPANAYIGGRRVSIGDDFYGYPWDNRYLDIGRGRRDDENSVLVVGSRCTFHDNRIDLSRRVEIGDDVGLSPEVVIYTHGYWLSSLEGYPCNYQPVIIGNGVIVGFRSVILPGAIIEGRAVIGAGSVVTSLMPGRWVCGGNPCRPIRRVEPNENVEESNRILRRLVNEYKQSCSWRGIRCIASSATFPLIFTEPGLSFDVLNMEITGDEDVYTDDFRDFLFRHGLRFYTKRRFKKLPKGYKP